MLQPKHTSGMLQLYAHHGIHQHARHDLLPLIVLTSSDMPSRDMLHMLPSRRRGTRQGLQGGRNHDGKVDKQ